MCGVPSIISAILMIFFIPESPKFTYAQGDEIRTLQILQRVYKSNTGHRAEDYKIKTLQKDEEFFESNANRSKGFVSFMWSQTLPLFKHPHLKNTLTASYLQFAICFCNNGFLTFFPDIVNKISLWLKNAGSTSFTVCQILGSFDINASDDTNSTAVCVSTLELSTFANIAIVTFSFSVLWLLTSIVINKIGKLSILTTVFFSTSFSSILLMFLKFPYLAIYLYYILLYPAVNMTVVNASTVELFPTNLR